jgi:hypothetical protein
MLRIRVIPNQDESATDTGDKNPEYVQVVPARVLALSDERHNEARYQKR